MKVAQSIEFADDDLFVLVERLLCNVDGDDLAQEEVVVADFLDADNATLDVQRAFTYQGRPNLISRDGRQVELGEFVYITPGNGTAEIDGGRQTRSGEVHDVLPGGTDQFVRVSVFVYGDPNNDGARDADVEDLAQRDDIRSTVLTHRSDQTGGGGVNGPEGSDASFPHMSPVFLHLLTPGSVTGPVASG